MINPTTHVITEFSSGLTPGVTLQQGLVAGPDGNLWFTESTPGGIGMINPTTHAITEFRIGLNPGSVPGASIVVGPDGALWFMDGGTTHAIGRIDPTTHAISEFSTGLNPRQPGPDRCGPGRQPLVRRQGRDPVDLRDESDHARDHRVHQRSERGQRSGWDLVWLGRQRLVHRPGHQPDQPGDRADRRRRSRRLGHRSDPDRVRRSEPAANVRR